MATIKKGIDYKVTGYSNKWSVIDTYTCVFGRYALLENNTYGDETCYLVVNMDMNVINKEYTKKSTGEKVVLPTIIGVTCETYDDIITALEDEGIL